MKTLDWTEIVLLIKDQRLAEAQAAIATLLAEKPDDDKSNFVAGFFLCATQRHKEAIPFFKRALELNPEDIQSGYYLATAVRTLGTFSSEAECRDVLLNLIHRCPDLIASHPLGEEIQRVAAQCCYHASPISEAIRLKKAAAERSQFAEEYLHLAQFHAYANQLDEAAAAVRKAIELDPEQQNETYSELLSMIEERRARQGRDDGNKMNIYPTTEEFRGDLRKLMYDHIATEHQNREGFITENTTFFTMGACFAHEVSRALTHFGYNSTNLDIAEHLNSSFANRSFVNWLENSLEDKKTCAHIEELLPEGTTREQLLNTIKQSKVFVLTLGSAAAFFDRETGAFALPSSNWLNMCAVSRQFKSRTTSVSENVDNVLYVLRFLRKMAPDSKIILTVSPAPLHMTFEFDSTVVADCLSKSTMRLTAHEVVYNNGLDDIYYWPSFELFRWAGSHSGPFYAADDGASCHVSSKIVDTMIDCFLEMFIKRQAA